MSYPASEKVEIIRVVEQSHLPVRRTLDKLGGSRPSFYRWYDLYRRFGAAGLDGVSKAVRAASSFADRDAVMAPSGYG